MSRSETRNEAPLIPASEQSGRGSKRPRGRIGTDSLLAQIRLTPESVKRRLRPVLVGLVRVAVAIPGGRRTAFFILHRMPMTGPWLLRRYIAYRQMQVRFDASRQRAATPSTADGLSRGEAVHLGWIEAASRSGHER